MSRWQDHFDEYHRSGVTAIDASNSALWQWQLAWALENTGPLEGRTMLDAGCGAGVLVSMAQALGATAIGFDFALCPSEERLDLFRADLNDPASWPEFGDVAEADVVTCIESLYYVPDPLETIWSLWSRVAPGGRMVITTGNSESGIVEQARRKHGGEYRGVHRGGLESLATQLPGCAKYEIIDVWIDAEQRFRPFTTAPRNRPPHRFTLVAQRG